MEMQLKALANKKRLAMMSYLLNHKHATVGELAAAMQLHIQSASQHLRILRAADVVRTTKRGSYVSYRLSLNQNELVKKVLSLL